MAEDPPPKKPRTASPHARWGTLFARGSPTDEISDEEMIAGLREALDKIGAREKVLLLPPDITRLMSKAGELACAAHAYYGGAVADVMPALGTHAPMTPSQIAKMYPTIPPALFREHDWRDGTVAVGTVPAADVRELTGGAIDSPWTATLNALVARGGHDLVLSMGQVVPHEALGMANYTKNLFIGVAGAETINFTHHIMAVYGVENVMGRASNPGRALFDRAFDAFCPELPALFAMTVVGTKPDGARVTRGFYVGDTSESFGLAARLSLEVNFTMVDEPHAKVVCLLDAHEYAFTWTANKAIYRTRLMVADGGELVVLAPGVRSFGERETLDRLIRKHGYRSSAETMSLLETDSELQENLVAAAHMMMGHSEGRFKITYCPSKQAGGLSREDIEKANFEWGDVDALLQRYDPAKLTPGPNVLPDGERIFWVPQPAAGLWASKARFAEREGD